MLTTTWKVQYFDLETKRTVKRILESPPTIESLKENIPNDNWYIVGVEPRTINDDLRWVYGTRTQKWHLIEPGDRDYNSAITQEEMKKIGREQAKEKYLGGHFI